MAAATSDSVLFFEEVDGDQRKVYLRGPIAPLGGPRRDPAFELGGSLRTQRVNEPGVSAGTTPGGVVRHITGSEEAPIEVKGAFRDGQLGSDGSADRLQKTIDDIRRKGRLLRIVWYSELRFGYLVEARFGIEGARDRQYHLKFEIDDVGGAEYLTRRRLKRPSVSDVSTLADDLAANQAALVKVKGLRFDTGSTLVSMFGAATRPLFDLLGALEDLDADIGDTADAYAAVANSASAFIARLKHLAGTLDGLSDPTDGSDAAAVAEWRRARAEALVALQDAAARARELGEEAERRTRGGSTGQVHIVVDGETVESIAAAAGTTASALWALNPTVPLSPPVGTRLRMP